MLDLADFENAELHRMLKELDVLINQPYKHENVRRWGLANKLFWWGGRWLSAEAIAVVAMRISAALYCRERFDHPFWSTRKEYGQSGYFYENTPAGKWHERLTELPYMEF